MIDVAALTGSGNYYEDFNVGDVYEHARGKTVEGLENVLLTNLVLNTAQAHFNEHLAESLPQKHRITFGGVTASIVIGLAMQDTGENALEEVGLDKVRFRVPVLHGDTLYAFSEVLEKNDSPENSRGHQNVGLVRFRHWGVNQRGETVFEGERLVLIKKHSFTTRGLEWRGEASAAASSNRRAQRARAAKQPAHSLKKTPSRVSKARPAPASKQRGKKVRRPRK